MIIVNKADKIATESDFLEFLEKISVKVLEFYLDEKGRNGGKITDFEKSGAFFENLVYSCCIENAVNTVFDGKIYNTKEREFPDIILADCFGIEVKATKKDDWTSIGNSVMESSRIKGVSLIYIFFGKLGGFPGVRYAKYQDCLSGIAVTHSPRYQINMNLQKGDSIFEKMGVDYDTIRKSDNPIQYIRPYYQAKLKQGESLWWINDTEAAFVPPIIKTLNDMERAEQRQIIAELFVVFPQIISDKKGKFDGVSAYLIAKHGVTTLNLRDFFTAGGKVDILLNGRKYAAVPRVLYNLLEHKSEILDYIHGNNIDFEDWKILLDSNNNFTELSIFEIFG